MREKELRLALVCYGGISLAVYMHGVTKAIWHATQASCAFHTGGDEQPHWQALFKAIEADTGIRLRLLPDIISGASAGGINGVFLAQAIATGQSLEPLTKLWLEQADVDRLVAEEARPKTIFTKFWAVPLAWWALRKSRNSVTHTVSAEARSEVEEKLARFVRSRWFQPPFGGETFCSLLLDALDAMAKSPAGTRLLPPAQPLDLIVSATHFIGHPVKLKLNSPALAEESEHRLTISFRQADPSQTLGDAADLTLAARSTASFPGAFPPFKVDELDQVIAKRGASWPDKAAFLQRIFPPTIDPDDAILIDGSVLANAPFRPAFEALRERPARREIDRRFVYIDPKPGMRAVKLTGKGKGSVPSFLTTIIGAMSDIPREQPIRENLEMIEGRSTRIRRMQRVIESIRPTVDATIERLFGRTFFLDSPTRARLETWRRKAQTSAALEAGYSFASYAQLKLSALVDDLVAIGTRFDTGRTFEQLKSELWGEIRARGADNVWQLNGKGASEASITFFRTHDIGYRVRRIRFLIRTVASLSDEGKIGEDQAARLRALLFRLLSAFLDRERAAFYKPFAFANAGQLIDGVGQQRCLIDLDLATDTALADAIAACPKTERRGLLFAYLGFPYFDISTFPLLQGEGLDEFDPIKVDRISPEDANAIRSGVTETLKGIEFNSFGAFFSRSYRENDYLWGRLHGAERLFDIICSSAGVAVDGEYRRLKRDLLLAIIEQEEGHLTRIAELFPIIRAELAAGPLK
jgi:patatin-related protein